MRAEAAKKAAEEAAKAAAEEAARIEAAKQAADKKAAEEEAAIAEAAKKAALRFDAEAADRAAAQEAAKQAEAMQKAAKEEAAKQVAAMSSEDKAAFRLSVTNEEPEVFDKLNRDIGKKLREENAEFGLKRTDLAAPLPEPPTVGEEERVATALKRSNAPDSTSEPHKVFVMEENALASVQGRNKSDAAAKKPKRENPANNGDNKELIGNDKKSAVLRIMKKKSTVALAGVAVVFIIRSVLGKVLRGGML